LLGEHGGLAFYTIGQRKGLGISSPHPLYVLEKKIKTNALIVGTAGELGSQELLAKNVNWISGIPPAGPINAHVKIRYKAIEAPAVVTPLPGNQVHVRFEQPMRDITPGQAVVFYEQDVCLGGGMI
jgi:tRNA-specific 2-thiouridylase